MITSVGFDKSVRLNWNLLV